MGWLCIGTQYLLSTLSALFADWLPWKPTNATYTPQSRRLIRHALLPRCGLWDLCITLAHTPGRLLWPRALTHGPRSCNKKKKKRQGSFMVYTKNRWSQTHSPYPHHRTPARQLASLALRDPDGMDRHRAVLGDWDAHVKTRASVFPFPPVYANNSSPLKFSAALAHRHSCRPSY